MPNIGVGSFKEYLLRSAFVLLQRNSLMHSEHNRCAHSRSVWLTLSMDHRDVLQGDVRQSLIQETVPTFLMFGVRSDPPFLWGMS